MIYVNNRKKTTLSCLRFFFVSQPGIYFCARTFISVTTELIQCFTYLESLANGMRGQLISIFKLCYRSFALLRADQNIYSSG